MKQGRGQEKMIGKPSHTTNRVSLDAVSQMGAHTKEGAPPLFKVSKTAKAPGCIACETHKGGSQGRH